MASLRRNPALWPINPKTGKPLGKISFEGVPGLHLTREGWRHKHYFRGKERLCSHGPWPATSAAQALEKAQALRKLLESGQDPARHRKAEAVAKIEAKAQTFGAAALAYPKVPRAKPWSNGTREKKEWFLRLLGALQEKPLAKIRRVDVMAELERLEARGRYETTQRVAQFAQTVLAFPAGS